MLQSRSTIHVPRRHGFLRGPLTLILALWAISYPGLLVILAAFGPIGVVLGVGVAILLVVPWLLGLAILAFLRWLA